MNKLTAFAGGLAVVLAISAACGGGGGSPAETATPARTERARKAPAKPTRAPTPTPTPAPAPGWTRHSTTDFRIDLPDTWETWDPDTEALETVLQELQSGNPDLAELAQEALTEQEGVAFSLMAFDTGSPATGLTNLNVVRQDNPLPMTMAALMAQIEKEYPAIGVEVLSTEPTLSIGGARAGKVEAAVTIGGIQAPEVQYLILPEPTVLFILTFTPASAEDLPALETVFQQIAESFRAQQGGRP